MSGVKFHDNEIEVAVLGIMTIDPSVIPNISKALQEADFFDMFNREVFRTILSLSSKGIVELIELNAKTGYKNPGFISSLTDIVPSSANWEYYTKRVKRFSMLRGLLKICETAKNTNEETIEQDLNDFIREATELSNISGSNSIKSARDLVPEMINNIEKAYHSKGELIGIDTGFSAINSKLDGFQNDFIIIGARPSIGKTALIVNMMKKQVEKNIKVGFVSCEMKDQKIMIRLLSDMTSINSRSLKNGVLKQSHFQTIQDCAAQMYEYPFYIDDTSIRLEQIVASCRVMVRINGVKILYIDHAGMIVVSGNEQKWEKGELISRTLKSLQKELNVPIILLSQLKPDAEGRAPTMADLRITGGFAEDGDVIGLLNREREANNGEAIPAEINWVKVKDGEIGPCKLLFYPYLTRFTDEKKEPK